MADRAATEMQDMANKMIEEGIVESVWTGHKETLYSLPELIPYYKSAYGKNEKLTDAANKIYKKVKKNTTISYKFLR